MTGGRRRATRLLADWLPLVPFLATVGALLIGAAGLLVVTSLRDATTGEWSLQAWQAIFQPGRTHLGAITSSLRVSLWTCTICVLIGTPLAWYVHALARRGRAVAIAITNTAANFGGVSLAVSFIITLGTGGVITKLLGGAGVEVGSWLFSQGGLVLVFCYFTIPLYVLLVLPAMGAVKDVWWEAVQVAAGTRRHYWRYVGIPVLAPFCFGGWALTFAWSMGQYAVVVALKSTVAQWHVMTERIGNMITTGSVFGDQSQQAAAYAVLLMCCSAAALVTYLLLSRRPMKRLAGT